MLRNAFTHSVPDCNFVFQLDSILCFAFVGLGCRPDAT